MTGKIIRTALSVAVILICTAAVFRIFAMEENKYEPASSVRVVYEHASESTNLHTEPEKSNITESAEMIKENAENLPMEEPATENKDAYNVQFPIDLNASGFEELVQLPGIGEALAADIIEYRESIGGFRNREQLLNIKGIGQGRYNMIYDLLYINGETAAWEEEEIPAEPPTEYDGIVLDVNKASAEDFDRLPGVNIELGRRIVELREEIGGFRNVLELLYAEGMSDELYVSIDEFLVCEKEQY